MHRITLSPEALATARATIDVTETTDPDIKRICNAWVALKASRGQEVIPARLIPSHLIDTTAQQFPHAPPLAREITAADIQARVLPRTIDYIRSRHITDGSDMGGAA